MAMVEATVAVARNEEEEQVMGWRVIADPTLEEEVMEEQVKAGHKFERRIKELRRSQCRK